MPKIRGYCVIMVCELLEFMCVCIYILITVYESSTKMKNKHIE